MKKAVLVVLMIVVSYSLIASEKIIKMREDKITQLIFPSSIKSFKGGFIPSDFAISNEDNVLYIQPMGSFAESNMNIITTDGCYYAFTIRYDPQASVLNFVFTPSDAIFKGVQSSAIAEPGKGDTVANLNLRPACEKILSQQGYLLSRNIEKLKNFAVIVKGIYIDNKSMYFRVVMENKSNIKYDIENIAFYVETIVKGKTSTQEKLEVRPTYIYNGLSAVASKGSFEAVFCFDKFTIGGDKTFVVSVLEKNGERNVNLSIHNELIIDARRYE